MLHKRIADEKDPGAFVQYQQGPRVRFCQGGKATISRSSCATAAALFPCAKGSSAASRSDARPSWGDATKLDDFAAKRERREELSALQRLGLVRHGEQTFVDAAFPIGRQPPELAYRLPRQISLKGSGDIAV